MPTPCAQPCESSRPSSRSSTSACRRRRRTRARAPQSSCAANSPELAVLLLSQDVETRLALTLMEEQPSGFGYLLKDRVLVDRRLPRRRGAGGPGRLRDRSRGRAAADGPPRRQRPPGGADAARARVARPDRRGALERLDRQAPVPQPEDRSTRTSTASSASSACPPRPIRTAACSRCSPTSARNIPPAPRTGDACANSTLW